MPTGGDTGGDGDGTGSSHSLVCRMFECLSSECLVDRLMALLEAAVLSPYRGKILLGCFWAQYQAEDDAIYQIAIAPEFEHLDIELDFGCVAVPSTAFSKAIDILKLVDGDVTCPLSALSCLSRCVGAVQEVLVECQRQEEHASRLRGAARNDPMSFGVRCIGLVLCVLIGHWPVASSLRLKRSCGCLVFVGCCSSCVACG